MDIHKVALGDIFGWENKRWFLFSIFTKIYRVNIYYVCRKEKVIILTFSKWEKCM